MDDLARCKATYLYILVSTSINRRLESAGVNTIALACVHMTPRSLAHSQLIYSTCLPCIDVFNTEK